MLTRQNIQIQFAKAVGNVLLIGIVALCLMLCTAAGASAQDTVPEQGPLSENEAGCGCHSMEKEPWQMSPHAGLMDDGTPVAACETCHGAYVRGHPDEGMIALDTDSSVCIACHSGTADQWTDTAHCISCAQCIGCH